MQKAVRVISKNLIWLSVFLFSHVNLYAAEDPHAVQPCWLESPLVKNKIGQIGVARDIEFGGKPPSLLAKMRATASLCIAAGLNCDETTLENAITDKSLQARQLYFDTFSKNGYVYAYTGFGKPSNKTCKPFICDITVCNPAWLCLPDKGEDIGILGVSYRATSPAKQVEMSIKNALFQAEYLYGVKIVANNELSQSRIGGQQFSIKLGKSDVDIGAEEKLTYFIANQCQKNGTLFSNIKIVGNLDKKSAVRVDDLEWLTNPKHLGYDGAVGVVDRLVASGLVSDQIKLAIKRAATELAFEKSSQISDRTMVKTSDENGLVQIHNISEKTDVSLTAQVKAIHFEKGNGSLLKVYVWLVFI